MHEDTTEKTAGRKLVFRGNIVVPIGNPFLEDDDQVELPTDCVKIGPCLHLLKNHVLKVDERGIITHVAPAQELSVDDESGR